MEREDKGGVSSASINWLRYLIYPPLEKVQRGECGVCYSLEL